MKKALFLISLFVPLIACNKEQNPPEKFVSFKVTGDKAYHFTNATWFTLSDKTWILAEDATDKTQIRLFLPINFGVGIYSIDSTQTVSALFTPQSTASYVADSGRIEITRFDPSQDRIEGNFHFSSTLPGSLAFQKIIEEGRFSVTY